MAEPRIRRNAGGVFTNDSGIPAPTSAFFRDLIPALAPASVSGSPGRYTDENLQKVNKLTLESFLKGQKYG